MALRHSIGTTAAILALLVAGPVLADDPVAPAAEAGPVLLIGGDDAADGNGYEASVWTDLRHFFSDTTFRFEAAPLRDDGAAADPDLGYNAYARIDLSGFAIGSHFAQWSEPTFFGEENQSFGFGASYTQESWTVGIDWSRGDYDEAFLDVNSGETSDVIAFTSSYDLRPGVQINGLLEYSEQEPAPRGADDGALTVGIGTLIHF